MYKVLIKLANGEKVIFQEKTILCAAARVDNYHGKMLYCDIQRIEGGEDNGGGQMDQTRNGIAGQQKNQADS